MSPEVAEDSYRQDRQCGRNITPERMVHILRRECEGIKELLQGELEPEERETFVVMLEQNRELVRALTA